MKKFIIVFPWILVLILIVFILIPTNSPKEPMDSFNDKTEKLYQDMLRDPYTAPDKYLALTKEEQDILNQRVLLRGKQMTRVTEEISKKIFELQNLQK